MYRKLILLSALSLGLAASPGAMAQYGSDHDRGADRGSDRHHPRDDDRSGSRAPSRQPQQVRHEQHRDDRHHPRADRRHDRPHVQRYRGAVYHPPRGYAHRHWRHGDRMPAAYRGSRYVIHDYRSYRLRTPPRGHHWVRVDRDVALTGISSGVVAAVTYGVFN